MLDTFRLQDTLGRYGSYLGCAGKMHSLELGHLEHSHPHRMFLPMRRLMDDARRTAEVGLRPQNHVMIGLGCSQRMHRSNPLGIHGTASVREDA
jgi:hypothetical protein